MNVPVKPLSREILRSPPSSDAWTANILMFHDHTLEVELLGHIVRDECFYVGAIGSSVVNAARIDALRMHGLTNGEIERMTAPAGVVKGA